MTTAESITFNESDSLCVHRQTFAVEYAYDVHFTRDAFQPERNLLRDVLSPGGGETRARVFVCLDAGVERAIPALRERIVRYFAVHSDRLELAAPPRVVPGGEAVKSDWSLVKDLGETFAAAHLDRQAFVVVVGGGSVLDMVGFVTALVHRGLRCVRMPTTVLAQNDAGVGVKNGMNALGVKNFAGTFAPPWAVIDDFSFLTSLPDEHWVGGIAEALKVAIIKDERFFDFLCGRAASLRRRDQSSMEELVRRCAVLHLEHIAAGGDPFELGTARPLDFGHWSAHRLEGLSAYRIGHGQAVAAGIALDSYYAWRAGLLEGDEYERILTALTASGLALWYPEMETRAADGSYALWRGLEDFREHLGGKLTVTLPRGIGRKVEVHSMRADWIEDGLGELRRRARG